MAQLMLHLESMAGFLNINGEVMGLFVSSVIALDGSVRRGQSINGNLMSEKIPGRAWIGPSEY